MTDENQNTLARRLGLFDAVMIVMGGIIGSGIFINPYVVAQQIPNKWAILGAWALGGLIALAGAFVYAELAAQFTSSGGQYVYLREGFHPSVAFMYGWALLLVTQTGGMAAVAVTFAKYALELAGAAATDANSALVAVGVLLLLTVVNCLGVRAGGTLQNVFMVLKIAAIGGLVVIGLTLGGRAAETATAAPVNDGNFALAFGAALIPVIFAYGGWQTSSFIAGEMQAPERNLPRGLLLGVLGVIAVYLSVNFVCVQVLGAQGLANTKTPASAVMRLALGETGARLIGVGIAVSTIGFLSQSMLTAPRVYFAMARDGAFFRQAAQLNRAQVPFVAIILQGVAASVIALSGRYEQILNYVVSVDMISFALTAATIFAFRRRGRQASHRVPGHPFTTIFFIVACVAISAITVKSAPRNSLIGFAIVLAGLPVYLLWRAYAGSADGLVRNEPPGE
jgi:APA family basic amino acid/polyamine antiporter